MSEQDKLGLDSSSEDGLIQGGTISNLDQDAEWRPEKHHAETARWIANCLLGVLVASFVVHYVAITVLSLYEKTAAVESLSSLFGNWLPVMSGFVGGAVTYYFTRRDEIS